MGKFTAEEIQIAKAVDLVDLAEQIGIPLKRKGRFYQAVGMDSVMIFNRSSWCRFSQVGGSTIDFLEYFRNMDFQRQSNICWVCRIYPSLKPCKNFNRKDRLKNRRNKTEKRHNRKEPLYFLQNQKPACRFIWLSDKTAEAVKADD